MDRSHPMTCPLMVHQLILPHKALLAIILASWRPTIEFPSMRLVKEGMAREVRCACEGAVAGWASFVGVVLVRIGIDVGWVMMEGVGRREGGCHDGIGREMGW